jgi:Holliday junction DNA helicase RuvB
MIGTHAQNQDHALRPMSLADYVGQPDLVRSLTTAIGAARSGGWKLDHALISGPAGSGKTSIARVIAHELGERLVIVHAPAITSKGDLCATLVGLETGDVLFVDEIHALPVKVQECLYAAMEDFRIDLPAGKGAGAKVISLPLPRFTLVAATTRVGVLAKPLVDRFGFHFQLRPYDVQTLAQIVARSAGKLGLAVDDDAAVEIARRSRGTPRIANKLLRRVHDHAAMTAAKGALVPAGLGRRMLVNLPIVNQALDDLGIDAAGLETLDRAYLAALATREAPVGVEAIAAALATEATTLEESVEPLLLQLGLIARTPRGRVATNAGREHLAISA